MSHVSRLCECTNNKQMEKIKENPCLNIFFVLHKLLLLLTRVNDENYGMMTGS